jgi:hypothetical protein
MKKIYLTALSVMLLVGGAVWICSSFSSAENDNIESSEGKKKKGRIKLSPRPKTSVKAMSQKVETTVITRDKKGRKMLKWFASAPNDGIYRNEAGQAYPPSEQRFFASLDTAFDKDDLASIRNLSMEIVNSKNRDLREKVVEALGWFGEQSVVELTAFLSDQDEVVAEKAHDEWVAGIQQIEDDKYKGSIVGLALRGLKDKSMLEDVANELVGMDELEALQVVVDVIEEGGAAVPYVKDAYETITGDSWQSVEAAENWLAENYDLDE